MRSGSGRSVKRYARLAAKRGMGRARGVFSLFITAAAAEAKVIKGMGEVPLFNGTHPNTGHIIAIQSADSCIVAASLDIAHFSAHLLMGRFVVDDCASSLASWRAERRRSWMA